MPRESTRMSAVFTALDGGETSPVRVQGATVWVALSGVLDAAQLQAAAAHARPFLTSRGRRVVLDGRRLEHLDYRAVRSLLAWRRELRAFGHQLLLAGWSPYLQAILCLEDWQRELSPGFLPRPAGAGSARKRADAAP